MTDAAQLWPALRARLASLALVPVTVVAGLGSRVVLGGLPAKIAGDALYTVLIYVLVVLVRPDVRLSRAFAVALGVSFAVEFFQSPRTRPGSPPST